MAKQPMLKFVNFERQMPEKRIAGVRNKDFLEIYSEFAGAKAEEQASRCSQCGVPYCQSHCPLHNNIPDWLKLTAEGRLQEAYEASQATNTFPEICGRICPQDRLCEGNCVIEQSGHETVTIGALEKYITDTAWEEGWVKVNTPVNSVDKSVGIIGAGPGGLAAADRLRQEGLEVTIYDRYDRAGGLLTYGIPGFKLEKDVVMRRNEQLEKSGVKFVLNTNVGEDITFDQIREKHDFVVLATGVYKARELDIPNGDLKGKVAALDYLTASNRLSFGDKVEEFETGTFNASGKKVVVIGGGDTAMDCNRTAIRQGAKSVTCIYRRDEKNMPGSRKEVINAKEEGVKFIFNTQPVDLLGNEKVEAVKTIQTRLTDPDHNDRQIPVPVPNSEKFYNADAVVIAFGFRASPAPWFDNFQIALKGNGLIKTNIDEENYEFQTSNEKIFSGGDMVRGSDLVVTAVWEGREAAKNIIGFLNVHK